MEPKEQPTEQGYYFATRLVDGKKSYRTMLWVEQVNTAQVAVHDLEGDPADSWWPIKCFTDYVLCIDPLAEKST